ncbi:MAG: helix-turn-helix domain-containing protein [Gammaproteobacteria bacterium]|nr:helix-turn-helix domain-containing protein [Gammaproteobacteria bacterium]
MTDSRIQLAQAFAERLVGLLQAKGLSSRNARGGVVLQPLAKIAGCSVQMARKYTLGLSLPDYLSLERIARWLEVSPAWLIYGENIVVNTDIESQISLDKSTLSYLLQSIFTTFFTKSDKAGLVDFVIDIMTDLAHVKTDTATIHKMIDMAISSAYRFKSPIGTGMEPTNYAKKG